MTLSFILAVAILVAFLFTCALCAASKKREPTRKTKEVRRFADYKHFDEDEFLRNRSERWE